MNVSSRIVTFLAVLAVVEGILGFVAGIALMLGGSLGSVWGAPGGTLTLVIGALLFAIGLVAFGLGGGFWMKRPWSWAAGLVVFSTAAVVHLATLLVGATILAALVSAGINASLVWLLLQPQTKAMLIPPGTEGGQTPQTQ